MMEKKRGPQPAGIVRVKWSPNFAYAIGLITTDGNLSPDGRHINFTTRDYELAVIFKKCLGLNNRIGKKARGSGLVKKYYCIQFGDVLFYEFLKNIGIMPRKSKIMASITIPPEYFRDFLRGHCDGDGTFYSYFDPRWRSSSMFYTEFTSASVKHILWLRTQIFREFRIKGHITKGSREKPFYQLKYAKAESLQLLPKIYYDKAVVCLSRKRKKIEKALAVIGKKL